MIGLNEVKDFFKIIQKSISIFKINDPLRLGAATAFFTVFGLPFILTILITVFGLVFSEEIITGRLFAQLSEIIGLDAAEQIQLILQNILEHEHTTLVTIAGSIFLIFVATTLFIVVQNSLNQIYKIKPSSKYNFIAVLKDRATSLAVILFTGLFVLLALTIDILFSYLGERIVIFGTGITKRFFFIASHLASFVVMATWFTLVFRFLPNAKVRWKILIAGGALTAFLFKIGQILLYEILVEQEVGTLYGAAGSFALVLLFVFYSSMIIYFGASFIKAYAEFCNSPVRPRLFATNYIIEETDYLVDYKDDEDFNAAP